MDSITKNKFQQLLDNISLETGELTNIYIDDFSGDGLNVSSDLKDDHISKTRKRIYSEIKHEPGITHTLLSNQEEEQRKFLKGKIKMPLNKSHRNDLNYSINTSFLNPINNNN